MAGRVGRSYDAAVQTTVERPEPTVAKLTITVDRERVEAALDEAARVLASSVTIPGFRPGRVPRKVLEKRLGPGALAEEAVRRMLPDLYSEAVQDVELPVVGPPRFDVERFEAGADGRFVATVDVRPDVAVPAYEGLEVRHPEWEMTDEEIDAQVDALRDRFAQLETVERPAQAGDYVLISITGRRKGNDEVVEEASGEDLLYRIPEEETDSELDRVLPGATAGAVLAFDDVLGPDYPDGLAGQEVAFTVDVKEVKEKHLPGLDDDFAITASEFDTLEELRDDLRTRMGREKRMAARANLRSVVVEAVADLVEDLPLPASLVEQEQRFRLDRLAHDAESHGLDLGQFMQAVGTTPEELLQQMEEEARRTVKAQLVVDAIGEAAGIEVEQQDLMVEISRQAQRMGRPPAEIAELLLHPDRIGALYADAFRRKVIDHVLERVEVLDAPPEEEHEPAPEDDPVATALVDDAEDEGVGEATAAQIDGDGEGGDARDGEADGEGGDAGDGEADGAGDGEADGEGSDAGDGEGGDAGDGDGEADGAGGEGNSAPPG